jgi:N-acetylmuramoyl-L-alanine amidase
MWLSLWGLGISICLCPAVVYSITKHTIEDVRFHSTDATTRVVIEVDGAVSHAVGRLPQPDRLYIDLPKTALASDWARKQVEVGDGRLRAIRIAQYRNGVVRVVLDLQNWQEYRVFTLRQPYRIIIDLQDNHHTPSTARPSPESTGSASPSPPPAAPPTIVIDPGHGGKDPGAVGPRGLHEKAVVLQVAKALQQVIRKELPHYRVILTRDQDVYVPLVERARIAERERAQVFISLHANASRKRDARGIETWYLSFAANERAQETAARENNMSTSQLSDLERILLDLQETDRINQSAILAGMTQNALVDHLSERYEAIPNRGVEGAPFVVLLHTSMPSILVEIAFISNPLDEKRLRSGQFQQALAQGIFQGVRQFLQHAMVKAE